MKRKQLLVVLVLLVGALLLYAPGLFDGERTPLPEEAGFSIVLDTPPVGVRIGRGGAEPLVLEQADGGWTVDGWLADSVKVEELLPALDTARAFEVVARNPANHPRLGVTPADGRVIEVLTETGNRFSFLLGNRDVAAGGYYVRMPDDSIVYRMVGPLGGILGREAERWRERVLARIDATVPREIRLLRDGRSFTLRRPDTRWTIDGSPADTAVVGTLLGALSGLSASGFASDSAAAAADFGRPDGVLEVYGADALATTEPRPLLSLLFVRGEAEGADWLVRREEGSPGYRRPDRDVYELTDFLVRRLLPDEAALRGEAAAAPGG